MDQRTRDRFPVLATLVRHIYDQRKTAASQPTTAAQAEYGEAFALDGEQ
ncbi:hypothetical protein ACWDX6_08640 [Streptomyces sp. NPDC003027]